jgi:hypothetical protein
MSGPLSVPLVLVAIYFSDAWVKAGFVILALVSAWVAAYAVWANERRARNDAEAKLRPVVWDAPMHEVVAHVAERINDTDTAKFWPEVRRVIRQAALDGNILICGHKSEDTGNPTATSWSLVSTRVPQAYWEFADITVGATVKSSADRFGPHTLQHRLSDGRFTQEKIPYYAKLMANWSQIKEMWP